MIKRYTREAMGRIWSDLRKFENWVRLEAESIRAQVALGMVEIPHPIPGDLEQTIVIDPDEIQLIEDGDGTERYPGTGHDVMAFLQHTSEQLPEWLRPFWHLRMTSMDPGETSFFMQISESLRIIRQDVADLMLAVKDRALEHKHTPCIGRTHGVHAEPITFGVKLANWYAELDRHLIRIDQAYPRLAVGKLSGAVGMYTMDPQVESTVCQRLGLTPIIATQVIGRDLVAEYLSLLALIASSVEKIATNLRDLQKTEIREIQEPFRKGQKGSSAMPHKRNPVGLENCCGLARVVQSNADVALRNQVNWHERDIANSSAERVVVVDSSIALDYILARLTRIIKGMTVNAERMLHNLNMTKGLVYSQEVMALVAERSGMPRTDAHRVVYDIAQACWDSGDDFRLALKASRQLEAIPEGEIDKCFDLSEKIKHTDYIFNQVFGAAA